MHPAAGTVSCGAGFYGALKIKPFCGPFPVSYLPLESVAGYPPPSSVVFVTEGSPPRVTLPLPITIQGARRGQHRREIYPNPESGARGLTRNRRAWHCPRAATDVQPHAAQAATVSGQGSVNLW